MDHAARRLFARSRAISWPSPLWRGRSGRAPRVRCRMIAGKWVRRLGPWAGAVAFVAGWALLLRFVDNLSYALTLLACGVLVLLSLVVISGVQAWADARLAS